MFNHRIHKGFLSFAIFGAAVFVTSCMSKDKIIHNAASAYCKCAADPAKVLARVDTLPRDKRGQMIGDIDMAVKNLSDCLKSSSQLRKFEDLKKKLNTNDRLGVEQQYTDECRKLCPEVMKWTDK